MTAVLDLRPQDCAILLDILRRSLPEGAQVWVFGSRATGRARRGSDLDLAIDAGRPLDAREAGTIAGAFEESDLPWMVDLVDLRAVSEAFAAEIARTRQSLPLA